MSTIALDAETTTDHQTVWMVSLYDVDNDTLLGTYKDEYELQRRLHQLPDDTTLVMHNGIGFDMPVLSRVWGIVFRDTFTIRDTYIMSQMYDFTIEGGHSLAAWGGRLGFPKDDFTDYDGPADGETEAEWCSRMQRYCEQDTLVTAKLYKHLLQQLRSLNVTSKSLELEQETMRIMTQQVRDGIFFDKDKASVLYDKLSHKMRSILGEMQKMFPPIVTKRYSDKQVDKQTGKPKRLKDHVEEFNPGSRQQIAKRLTEAGVRLTETTETGQYKIDETVLARIDHPASKKIAQYMMVQKRIGQLDQWFAHCTEESRIHGGVRPIGTATFRQSQQNPNLGQVPSVDKEYGKECRELFCAPAGMVFLGCDASGLELRCFANRTRSQEYIEVVTEGDAHQYHADLLGIDRRDAKTFLYAFLYGAGDAKLGSIVGGNGGDARALFNDRLPGLRELTSKVQEQARTGIIRGLDGRAIRAKSEHSALNYQLQSDGAIIMKQACVRLHQAMDHNKARQVVAVHDEWQFEVTPEYADDLGALAVMAIQQAGKDLNMVCPLDGEYKVGNNWAETH